MINLHRKLTGEVPSTYNGGGAAIAAIGAIVSAAIGAGSSYRASNIQQKAASSAQTEQLVASTIEANKRKKEAEEAKATAARIAEEGRRVAEETRPDEQGLGEVQFGADDDEEIGSTQDFLVPKSSALGSSGSGRSGLGFKV